MGTHLYGENYFYERVPIRTENGDIHIYGEKLKKYVFEWMGEVRAHRTTESFQVWMERKLADDDVEELIQEHAVRYFGERERRQTEIHVDEEGCLSQIGLDARNSRESRIERGVYVFVLAEFFDRESGRVVTKLYAAPKIRTERGKIQHSSFLRGANVKSAGMLTIDERGHITSVSNRSGHYRPSPTEMAYFIEYLRASHYDVSRFHVVYPRNRLFYYLCYIRDFHIECGFVNQNAERWFRQTGSALLAPHPEIY